VPDTDNVVLSVSGLEVKYGLAQILRDVELQVLRGTVTGLAGRNGAGKTTTLRAISGLVERVAGSVRLCDRPLPSHPHAVARAGVSHVPEGRGLLRSLTVRENLRLAQVAVSRQTSSGALERQLTAFPSLTELLDQRSGLLSGGQQQLVAIARGLIAQPTVLMIDELSLGLSPRAVRDVLDGLLSAARDQGVSLLIVDQNVKSLIDVCDRLYFLKNGRTRLWVGGSESNSWQDIYFR